MTLPYKPTDRQTAFHTCQADEALFGGSAGGGKSMALLLEGLLEMIETPGNHGILMRRTYPELEKSLILESQKLFPQALCKYNDQKHRWTIRTNGADSYLDFGFCENDGDVFKYQSAQYGYLGWDELTHSTEFQYTYLTSRVRSANPNVWARVRSATNPGNIGHGWVKKHFRITDHSLPRDMVWRPEPTLEQPRPPSRAFIPAGLYDNPHLMLNDPGYEHRLRALPEIQRRMLLYGDWSVFSGQFFSEFSKETHVCKPFEIPAHWKKYRAVDSGFTAPFACLWIAVSPEGRHYVYRELYQTGLRDKEQAKLIVTLSKEPVEYTVGDPAMSAKKSDSGTSAQENYLKAGVALISGSNARVPGWMCVRNLLANALDGKPYLMFFENARNVVREIEEAIHDSGNQEDVDTTGSDHAIDALRYFAMTRPSPTATPDGPDPMAGKDKATRSEWNHFNAKARESLGSRNRAILHELNRGE